MEIHANSKTSNSKLDTYVIVCMRDTHSLGAIAQMQVQYNIKRGPYLCNPFCHLWSVKMHSNKSRHVIIDSRVKLSLVIYQHSATFRINWKTRIAERRFLTGLQRGYFFSGEGAAIHTQATIKPCRQPLHATESYVRLKHKLIQNIVPF